MNETTLLKRITSEYTKILAKKLVGIYLHGSLAFGCYNRAVSDIDFLVVVNSPLTQAEKEALITVLLSLDSCAPKKGFEMSVILDSVCSPFIYPTPYELHFSNAYRAEFSRSLSETCAAMHGTDRDLAAHITVINSVGITLCGKDAREVFTEVPREYFLDSIRADIADAAVEIQTSPVYCALNLCRVLAFTEENLILSKRDGGLWALPLLPQQFHTVVSSVLYSYERGMPFECRASLTEFAEYMLRRIF